MATLKDGVPFTSTGLYNVSFSPVNLFGFQGRSDYSLSNPLNSTTATSAETNVTPLASGITEVQGAPQYGNYLNIGNLSAKDRKFIRLSGGYLFVGSDGKVYNIAPGTSRKDMRKWYKQEKRAQEIARRRTLFGGTNTQFNNPEVQRIYDAGVQNPNAQFISYTQKKTPVQPTDTPKYTYKFTGTADSNKLYIALMNRLRSNDPEWTKNYAINNVITNDSIKQYLNDILADLLQPDWDGKLNNTIYQQLLDKLIIDQDYLDNNNITLIQEAPNQENANGEKKVNPNLNRKVNYLAGAPTKKVENAIFQSWESRSGAPHEAWSVVSNYTIPNQYYLVGYTNNGRPVIYGNNEYAVWEDTEKRRGYVRSSHLAWDNKNKYFTWHK